MFTIDFTKPWLYKDIIYFNQGNLSTNNTLRCKLVTGGSDDFTGGSIACTFTTKDSVEISGFGRLVDAKGGIVDIVFPSNALVVGTNKLEVLVNRADGGVAQSPSVMYDIWQGLTTGNGIEAETNYPILIELINSTNEASNKANLALNKANSMITDLTDAIDNAYRSANEADIATSNANSKITELDDAKTEMITKVDASIDTMKTDVNKTKEDMKLATDAKVKEIDTAITNMNSSVEDAKTDMQATTDAKMQQVDNSIANMKVETNTAIDNMVSKTDEKIADVDRAIAAGTKDLEVKEARRDMDGVEHDTLKLRLESDLKKGKVIEETKEGTYLSFNDTIGGLVSDIEVFGNTVQDISNLANIRSSCIPNGDGTFKMSILSVGENIFDGKFELGSLNGVTGQNLDSSTNCRSDFIKVGNKQISWLLENSSGGYIFTYDKDKKFISSRVNAGTYRNYTLEDNAVYIRVRLQDANVNTKMTIVHGIVGLTNHIPYQETRCDIKLPCQLEKWDRLYFDKEENAWCVEKGTHKATNFIYDAPNNVYKIDISKEPKWIPKSEQGWNKVSGLALSNKGIEVGEWTTCKNTPNSIFLDHSGAQNPNIALNTTDITGAYILCKLATPKKIELPQSEQIKLNSFANKTHIYTISGDVDATVKATVSKSLASTVQANTNEINILNGKIEDIQGLKESQDFAYETDKGYLVCKDTQNGVVKDLKVYGRTKLVNTEGIEVEPGTDGATLISIGNGNEIEVLSVNQNLFSSELELGFINSDGSMNSTDKYLRSKSFIKVFPNLSYIISEKNDLFSSYVIFEFDENKKLIKRTVGNKVVASANTQYIKATFAKKGEPSLSGIDFKNVSMSLNIGTDKKEYTAYKQDKKTILFKDTDNTWKPILNLRGIDENNCDIVDSVNNVFHENIDTITLNGSENWVLGEHPGTNTISFACNIVNRKFGVLNMICDKLPIREVYSEDYEGIRGYSSSNLIMLRINRNRLSSPDLIGFKKWLQDNNIELEFVRTDINQYEINPIFPNSYENETMISFGSGAIAPHASWKITSSLPNFVKELSNQIKQLQEQVYKTNVANFAVALNTLDTKLRLDRLEAPQM